MPTSLADILGPFKSLPSVAVGEQQAEAAANMVKKFPGELAASWDAFVRNLRSEQFVRLLLTPQHFTYGNNGMAARAADFVAGIPRIKATGK